MKAAHFLLTPNLWNSPPNDALSRVYQNAGYEVDFYSPNAVGDYAHLLPSENGLRWIFRNALNLKWRHYDAFSCTTEDPVAVAGVLAFIWRKPLIVIADEIKSGGYYGDRREYWKKLCRWALRRAKLTFVNDQSRVPLQRVYAGLRESALVVVYPGCFLNPPQADSRAMVHAQYDVPENKTILAFSGRCTLDNGVDWALESLPHFPDMMLLMQPLTVDPMSAYLLARHRSCGQIRIAEKYLSWQQSWSSMGGVDIGVSIYRDPAPQFQNMGISSNRLCMFLAMGVPVIVNKQPSFAFVEEYQCGIMVENADEFRQAVADITNDLRTMKENALRCAREYIDTSSRFAELDSAFRNALGIETD